jgi:LacI family transcriptional regulator
LIGYLEIEMSKKRTIEPGISRATIHDIAARAGVSVTTVSRVLNGRPDVSEATRASVLKQVEQTGYESNRSARGLVSGSNGLIGVTVPAIQAEYYGGLLAGVAEALDEHDLRVVLCPTRNDHEREVALLSRLMHGTTDGAILIHPTESNEELLGTRQQGYPLVVIDPPLSIDRSIPVVASAHWSGGRVATEHLLELGHTRIGVVTGPARWSASKDRLAGYRSALQAGGIEPDAELSQEADFTVEGGQRAAELLLDLRERPTAIFALNDNMAVGVLHAAKRHGIRVPEELSVVGVDDAGLAATVVPRLTTIRQPLQEMGRVAVSLLWRILEGRQIEAAPVLLSTQLMVRESTAWRMCI